MFKVTDTISDVFPAHAGMSLANDIPNSHEAGFPRSRGDEPCVGGFYTRDAMFSPLTRG